MPIYEYHCPQCGTKFEKLIRSSFSAADVRCPTCGYEDVKRTVSMFGMASSSSGGGGSSCAPSGGG